MSFAFGFSGDDIDVEPGQKSPSPTALVQHVHETPAPAFPVPGKPQLPPTRHDVTSMITGLPSKIAFDTLNVVLDDGQMIKLPRRELWDVRMQIMAEEEVEEGGDQNHQARDGLGDHDVKTGVYEGGFKSWESSVDLVKVLAAESHPRLWKKRSARIIELGCGTALPSLALFQWIMTLQAPPSSQRFSFILADYNPSVLQLVTLPNFILSWAFHHRHTVPALQDVFLPEGELELSAALLEEFQSFLTEQGFELTFFSGGWSPAFVELLYAVNPPRAASSREDHPLALLLGSETIYSPFSSQAFTEMVVLVLAREATIFSANVSAWVAAKRLYFGVGGSLDDFVHNIERSGIAVAKMREENEGVRRGVVRCVRADEAHGIGTA